MGILPASKWRFLKHLSLADNSITSIPATSLAPLSNTLHSLDLSSNLFTQIPDSLATLTALRALNLSHCMIDSLHSLTRNPLPAITALNMRANRLQSIAGIEKLYPLERLDLRDNRLTDPMELARLTGIPDIREIWVSGNPFTRTHRDYRVTIFNLFRQTPGYTEDIVIDATGPTYAERRYLVERVPVPAAVPVVKEPAPEIPAVDVSKPAIVYDTPREPAVLRKERPVPKAVTSEVNSSSTRRRKTPKRRIVDLASTDGTSNTVPIPPVPATPEDILSAAAEATAAAAGSDSNYRISAPPEVQQLPSSILTESRRANSQPEVPRIDTSVVPELPPAYATHDSHWKESQDWGVSGELYRRKIEALRDKVGNGYLSALSEESWDPSRPPNYAVPDFSPASTIRASPTTPRTNSAQAIHSGRTIG
jgi:Leucine rich repeat